MAAQSFVRTPIDKELKDEAAAVLAGMGLTISDLVRLTLARVAKDKGLPFDLKRPTAETQAAMTEARALMQAGAHRFDDGKDLFDALEKTTREQ